MTTREESSWPKPLKTVQQMRRPRMVFAALIVVLTAFFIGTLVTGLNSSGSARGTVRVVVAVVGLVTVLVALVFVPRAMRARIDTRLDHQ
jgi:membrane associated rhomboid family serine protease